MTCSAGDQIVIIYCVSHSFVRCIVIDCLSLILFHVMCTGARYPLELHIVNFVYNDALPSCPSKTCTGAKCPPPCIAVVGIMFELTTNTSQGNKFLDTVFKYMPYDEGVSLRPTALSCCFCCLAHDEL